jgi:hypothetical protein
MSAGGTYENGLGHGKREDLKETTVVIDANSDNNDDDDDGDDDADANDKEEKADDDDRTKPSRPLAGIRRTKV